MEEFRIIKEFTDYEISNFGRVRNIKTGLIKKTKLEKTGYHSVCLNKDKKPYTKLIHRLLAILFIDNPNNKSVIDHIDGNKINNNLDNLRWCTHSENSFNSKIPTTNTSGNKGVYYRKDRLKWIALIEYNKVRINLGRFEKKEDAIKARVDKARELFGEFINKCEIIPELEEL